MRCFFDAQSPKESQFYDACLIGIPFGESLERLIHGQHFSCDRVGRRVNRLKVQCNPRYRTAALQGPTAPRVVYQNSSHQLRRDSKELCPTLPGCVSLIDELQKDFVNECGRLKGVIRPLAPQLVSRDAPQFWINQRHQTMQRRLVATTPLGEYLCNRIRSTAPGRLHHSSLESNTSEQILEPRIGAYGIVRVVDQEVDHVIRPFAIGRLQPGKCGVVVTELDIQARKHTG